MPVTSAHPTPGRETGMEWIRNVHRTFPRASSPDGSISEPEPLRFSSQNVRETNLLRITGCSAVW